MYVHFVTPRVTATISIVEPRGHVEIVRYEEIGTLQVHYVNGESCCTLARMFAPQNRWINIALFRSRIRNARTVGGG